MRKIPWCFVVLLVLSLCMLTGCVSESKFTMISSKNVNLANIQADRMKMKGRTSGQECQHWILFIPTSSYPTIGEAMDRALEEKKADVLRDGVVTYHYFFIPILYMQQCWTVEGDAYDTYE